MACYDSFYEAHSLYQQQAKQKPRAYLYNEKRIYHGMVPPKPVVSGACDSVKGAINASCLCLEMMSFFKQKKEQLFVPCSDRRPFSHCQEFFLMQYSGRRGLCSSFAAKPCGST